MSFPRYPKYKDTGMEWLGEVPEHWEVISIKWLSPVKRGASPRPIDDPKYFDNEGEFAWVRIADVSACDGVLNETTQRLSEFGSSLSVKIAPGELFVSIAGTVGKPCISAIKACIHDGFVYFPTLKINPLFLYRIFEGGVCYGGLGKWGTQLNLNTDTIGSIRVALPPADELETLLEFLDRETGKIDELVAEQRLLMELLKDKRQAVISHAVTRGLNSAAPLKPSGIEWLGDVPAHWEVARLKSLASGKLSYGANESAEDDNPSNPRFIRITDINDDGTLRDDTFKSLSPEVAEPYLLQSGDLLLARSGATVGKSVVYKSEWGTCCYAGYLIRLRCNPTRTSPSWVNSFAQSSLYWGQIAEGTIQATIQNFSAEKYGEMKVPLPPLAEQIAIAFHLNTETGKLDTLTAEAHRAIDLLQERRTALISAAVTGQIDVRQLAAKKAA